MTEKELKKLNRKQLLELLLIQTNRADELEIQLSEARKALDDREIALSKAGTIAEAALKLNGIFEAADAAAKQYLDNIKRLESALAARAQVSGIDEPESEPENVDDDISNEKENLVEDTVENSAENDVAEAVEEPLQDSHESENIAKIPEPSSELNVKPLGEKQCKTKKIIITKATAISTSKKNIPPEQTDRKKT